MAQAGAGMWGGFWYRVFFGRHGTAAARFIRYQMVNVSSFILDLVVLFVCMFVLGLNYLLATGIGFTAAVLAAFFLNRAWSFRKWVHTGRIALAFFVGLGSLGAVLFVTYVGVETIHLPYLEARLTAALVAAVVSYVGDSIFTFELEPFE